MLSWKRSLERFSINTLYEYWKRGDLVLQPGFQREFVWTRLMTADLVMCVLNDLDIGKIQLRAKLGTGKRENTMFMIALMVSSA